MAYDLMIGARPDERFHVQSLEPAPFVEQWGPWRRTTWGNLLLPDGSPGEFVSTWLWKLQWYVGTTKCDGTRTHMLNIGQLGDATPGFVMTTTPKELSAFRWRAAGPSPTDWRNMGGS